MVFDTQYNVEGRSPTSAQALSPLHSNYNVKRQLFHWLTKWTRTASNKYKLNCPDILAVTRGRLVEGGGAKASVKAPWFRGFSVGSIGVLEVTISEAVTENVMSGEFVTVNRCGSVLL